MKWSAKFKSAARIDKAYGMARLPPYCGGALFTATVIKQFCVTTSAVIIHISVWNMVFLFLYSHWNVVTNFKVQSLNPYSIEIDFRSKLELTLPKLLYKSSLVGSYIFFRYEFNNCQDNDIFVIMTQFSSRNKMFQRELTPTGGMAEALFNLPRYTFILQ